jgi:hypothetical protein
MSPPTNEPEMKDVLGTANYYRKFVKDYSTVAAPLNNLLRNDVAWYWSATCKKAFDMLKVRLTEAPILRRLDYLRLFGFQQMEWRRAGCSTHPEGRPRA